jgi:hypothetical protein
MPTGAPGAESGCVPFFIYPSTDLQTSEEL